MDTATSSSPTRRRIRSVKPAPTPSEAPAALQKQVQRKAVVLDRHRKVLGAIGMQAVQTATLQVVAQQLADIQALLRANGVVPSSPVAQPAAPLGGSPPAHAGPSCCLCGRPGVYQSRTARVARGQQRPWYCAGVHAQQAQAEDGNSQAVGSFMSRATPTNPPTTEPAPAAGATSLTGAMAALLSNEG